MHTLSSYADDASDDSDDGDDNTALDVDNLLPLRVGFVSTGPSGIWQLLAKARQFPPIRDTYL